MEGLLSTGSTPFSFICFQPQHSVQTSPWPYKSYHLYCLLHPQLHWHPQGSILIYELYKAVHVLRGGGGERGGGGKGRGERGGGRGEGRGGGGERGGGERGGGKGGGDISRVIPT